jgi:hypothetical protein
MKKILNQSIEFNFDHFIPGTNRAFKSTNLLIERDFG